MNYCLVEPLESRIAPATLSIADASITEGNAGAKNLTFTVTLSEAVTENVSVSYATANGTAVAGSDYSAAPANSSLTFTPGSALTRTVSISITGDTTDEVDETFLVDLSNPVGATIADGQAQGTIRNDEVTLSVADVSKVEGLNGTTVFEFVVTRSGGVSFDVSVDYATADGTATVVGGDYVAIVPGTLTIPAGQTSGKISVTVNGDGTIEPNESFFLNFTNERNATMSDKQAVGTIINDDPTISINDLPDIVEGDTGTVEAVFTVTLATPSTEIVTVDFSTVEGTTDDDAKAKGAFADFLARSGTLTFDPNDPIVANRTSQTFSIPIIGDLYKEATEELSVQLSNAFNGTIGDGIGTVKILNGADSIVGLALEDTIKVEGNSGTTNAIFKAVLSGTSGTDVTFTLNTQNGTAVSGSDYIVPTTTAYTIAANETSISVPVEVRGETTFEAVESFFVNLTNASANVQVVDDNAFAGAQATARGYIFNDDTQAIGTQTLQWVDVDGDLVTMKVNKGAIGFNSGILTLSNSGTNGGKQLQRVDLTGADSAVFAGTSISITAARQAGLPVDFVTDGRVDVGYIHAAIFDTLNFQVFGKDLGAVTIDGDLGKIDAGDSFSTAAIAKLDVFSLGMRGTSTGAPDTQSDIIGPVPTVNVTQNVQGFLHIIGAEFGRIGTLKIGGALQGTSAENSGQISVTGTIANATIGSIVGGSGDSSGLILGSTNARGNLGKITVLGDIVGGAGDSSGKIQALKISSVSAANVIGGAGAESGIVVANSTLGPVTLSGDLRGGTGNNSGEIFGGTSLGAVRIGGDIVGGSATDSGSVVSRGNLASLTLGGALLGGAGRSSGTVQATGTLGAASIGETTDGDSIVGGSGSGSGQVFVNAGIKSLITTGNVQGGAGAKSGGISTDGTIDKVVIGQNLIGGNAPAADPEAPDAPAVSIETSGFIFADRLKSVSILGDIVAGEKLGDGGIAGSGVIRGNTIESVNVSGDLIGNADNPVIIGAAGLAQNLAIKSVVVQGSVAFAEILAGYQANATPGGSQRGDFASADASIGTVTISGNVKALNIIAGAQAGVDARFGTADDRLMSGLGVLDTAAIAQIASVIIKGEILPHTASNGIVAQHIILVKTGVSGIPLVLTDGPGNDLAPVEIGVDNQFRALELPLATS